MGILPRLLYHHLATGQCHLLPDHHGQEHQLDAPCRRHPYAVQPVRRTGCQQKQGHQGIEGGYATFTHYPELGECLLICVTETKHETDLDAFYEALKTAIM